MVVKARTGGQVPEGAKEKWIPGNHINLQDMLKAGYVFSRRKGKVIRNSKSKRI